MIYVKWAYKAFQDGRGCIQGHREGDQNQSAIFNCPGKVVEADRR